MPGDRVVAAFDIAYGRCYPCAHGVFSGCAATNASAEQELLYGNRTAALFGYSHLTGGVPGGQVREQSTPSNNRPILF
jgi:threonine dehydrogenase-like Zn-dependent dehydrogenase